MSPGAAVIKHYQIVSCLGQGGFGKVYEAWDSKLQRSVAIKCLNADGLLSPAADLIREARMAASLSHAAFVKIYALEENENNHAIIMELVRGETLKNIIANDKPKHSTVLDVVRQIAEAMQQAHTCGLIHGDLKPSNLMLEPEGLVRILDFGLACMVDTQTTTSLLQQDPQGTIAYMAPERLLGVPLAPQIDVYALGVILFELLNGRRPFADLGGLALAAALVQSSSDQWDYPLELPYPLIQLIRRMTAKQPCQRFSSMGEVIEALDSFESCTVGSSNVSGDIISLQRGDELEILWRLYNKDVVVDDLESRHQADTNEDTPLLERVAEACWRDFKKLYKNYSSEKNIPQKFSPVKDKTKRISPLKRNGQQIQIALSAGEVWCLDFCCTINGVKYRIDPEIKIINLTRDN
ncbi:MAG: hypothetical protein B0W54_23340 [Cellvibrio sp. 79]|nr:MAG: hypothetical protein B0W54_23340 [Cellvibrio sp. 79]